MLDKFSKVLQSASNNPSLFKRVVANLRGQISTRSYFALQDRIRKNFPKYAAFTLMPSKRENWADLKYVNILLPPLEIKNEVAWQVLQLKEHINQLNEHVRLVGEFVEAMNLNDLEKANVLLAQHYRDHGATLWNLEARISLASRSANGSVETDNFILQLKPDLEGSIAYFIGYILADLYDQATTYSSFSGRVQRLMSPTGGNYINSYLKVKVLRETFTSFDLASYLAIEASHSYIDAYEAVLNVIPESILLEDGVAIVKELIYTAQLLKNIKDIRLHSQYRHVSGGAASIINAEDSDLFLDRRHFPRLEKIGQVLSGRKETSGNPLSHVESIFANLLTQFCDERLDLYEVHRNLSTTISKYRFLPWHKVMESSMHGLFFPLAVDQGYLAFLALCIPESTLEADEQLYADESTSSLALPEYGIFVHPWLKVYSANPARRRGILAALWKLNHKDAVGSIQELDKALVDSGGSLYGIFQQKITALLQQNDENTALSLCVNQAVARESIAVFLPFDEIVGNGKSWADLEHYDFVDLAIGLHFAASSGGSMEKFNLEFACKKLLTVNQCRSLGDFATNFDKSDKRLAFLLWKIFIPSNLRLVNFLRSIEEVDNARLDVCRILLDLKKDDVEAILEEIRNIIRRKELRQAEKNVEGTRIHVNREGIKRWAEEKYREEFQRIKKSRLVRIAPTITEIEANLAQLLSDKGKGASGDSVSKNMEDPLFAMGVGILTNCFSKGDDGLEHFLSLRIRHGSLTGYLRAPLERAELVEQGELTEYSDLSQRWMSRLSSSDSDTVFKVIAGLSDFQKKFDLMIEEVRTKYIQVRSSEKPNGLFAPKLQKVVWDAFHLGWENAESFDKFFDTVWDAFLLSLENGLEEVRTLINVDVLSRSEKLFMELSALLNDIELSPADRAVLITAINQGTTGLQEAIRVVTQWFEYKDNPLDIANITFDQLVELALKVFRNARPALSITVNNHSEPLDILMSNETVPRLIDAFFILLDNVYQHSGLKGTAAVDLWTRWESYAEGKGFLEVKIENSLAHTVDMDKVKSEFEQKRAMLSQGGNEDLLNIEGGSGLIKLARLAKFQDHHLDQPLEFLLTDEGKVRVIVRIAQNYREATLFGA